VARFSLRRALQARDNGTIATPEPVAPAADDHQQDVAMQQAARLVANESWRTAYDLALTEPLRPEVERFVQQMLDDPAHLPIAFELAAAPSIDAAVDLYVDPILNAVTYA
jgi:hypothetical protein